MLIDANRLDPGSVLSAEYCVIGSGMGGSAVAQDLCGAGKDVLLIEAGTVHVPATDRAPVSAEYVGRSFNMPVTRCIELGGTSNQWHGICAPLDEIDFATRPWIRNSGWAVTRDQLKSSYLDAASLLDIPSNGWFEPDSLSPGLRAGLEHLGFNRELMQTKLVYTRHSPMRWKKTLLKLAGDNVLRCLMSATALELVTDTETAAVQELYVGTARGTVTIRARTFVLCCGGLETPRLLLNSKRSQQHGLGNTHDLVGRNLIDHPAGHFCKLGFRQPLCAPLFAGLPVNDKAGIIAGLMIATEHQRTWSLPNNYVWIRPSVSAERIDDELMLSFLKVRGVLDLSLRQISAILTNRDILYRALVHRFGMRPKYRYGDLWFMTEQLPNPDSRVRLSTHAKDRYGYPIASVDWQLSAEDIRQFHAYATLLFECGLRSEQYTLARIDDPDVWNRNVASAAHHLGTARMADHPSRGVVDSNLRVFGVQNLYICDASVFPTAGSVNPSLTITALALRLSRHLIGRPD